MFRLGAIKSWWAGDAVKARIVEERKAGLRALAEFVAERARLYAPYDTGELRDSIHVVSEADGLRHHVFATARHSEPVEFGYVHYRSGRFIPPRAYMRKAVNDGAKAMPQFIGGSRVRQGYHAGRLMGATFE